MLPGQPSSSIQLAGQAEAVLMPNWANVVYVDPATFLATGGHRGEELSLRQRISEMADPLHFGTIGGFASRCLWFVFEPLLSGLSITGTCIHGLRIA